MFNGAGMLHQVQIRDGRAWYSNSYVRTPRFENERQAGRELYPEFGDIAGNGKKGFARIVSSAMEKRLGLVPALSNIDSASSTTAIQIPRKRTAAARTPPPMRVNHHNRPDRCGDNARKRSTNWVRSRKLVTVAARRRRPSPRPAPSHC